MKLEVSIIGKKVRKWLKKIYWRYDIKELVRNPFLWIYASYLTIRYVDDFIEFPAIRFKTYVKVVFKKNRSSSVVIGSRLVFEAFIGGTGSTTLIVLSENSKLIVEKEFALGDGIKINISNEATLLLKGKEFESVSGVTANSVIMVNKYLEIGKDCIIAWDTFLTDCDWHSIEGKRPQQNTIIGDHVWIGVGVKVLKGVTIGRNSIVTSNTVVLKGAYNQSCLISGNPGKIIKSNIPDWNRDMDFSKGTFI